MRERHDTIVIGGGQAGLAMSAVLRRRGREHVVLERNRIAERWRGERWDSLRFQFPNWTLELPGVRYCGNDPDGFASSELVVNLIEELAVGAPVCEHTPVLSLSHDGRGFLVTTDIRRMEARQVVIATGPFHRPRIPAVADLVPASILQTDAVRYRNPDALPDGAVLVVGCGASGTQIADELREAGRRVFLAVGRYRRVPRRFRGHDAFAWLTWLGRFDQPIDTFPNREYPVTTVFSGVNGGYDVDVRAMAASGVRVLGRIVGGADGRLGLAGNANQVLDEADAAYRLFVESARDLAPTLDVELGPDDAVMPHGKPVPELSEIDLVREGVTTVIWAVGYDYEYPWLDLPVLDARGQPAQRRGVTAVPGLYFLGLHWMHTFKSGTVFGVERDAEYLAEAMQDAI